jgi:hypothetical protein
VPVASPKPAPVVAATRTPTSTGDTAPVANSRQPAGMTCLNGAGHAEATSRSRFRVGSQACVQIARPAARLGGSGSRQSGLRCGRLGGSVRRVRQRDWAARSSRQCAASVLAAVLRSRSDAGGRGRLVLWRADQRRVTQRAKGIVEYGKEIADLDGAESVLVDLVFQLGPR